MTGLVEQLQAEALDQSISVSTLLRKVKVAAVKLRLADTVDWADHELRGYTESVPEYRMVHGRAKAYDPHWGWSVIGGEPKLIEALSRRAVGQPISSLEQQVSNGSADDELMVTLPQSVVHGIVKGNRGCHDAGVFISQADLTAIVDHVRNLVLDWALDLERAGITGEGLSFSPAELERAAATPINIKIEGANARLNIGSIDHSSNAAE